MHCNLKPQQILFKSKNSDQIKIIDLGLNQMIKNNQLSQKETETIYFLAPEMIKVKYDPKVAIWSAGLIFYILMTGEPPFNAIGETGINYNAITKKILQGDVDLQHKAFNNCDSEVPEIIKLMLTIDPLQRPDAKDILILPWFEDEVSHTDKNTGLL